MLYICDCSDSCHCQLTITIYFYYSNSTYANMNVLKNAFKTFAQQIGIKLDNNNFLSWKQQVEGIIRIHKLHRHLVNPEIPPRFLTTEDRESDSENPAYQLWHQEDSLLFMW